MNIKSSALRSKSSVPAVLLLLVLGLAGYYYQHYTSNHDYLVERSFRVLGTLNERITVVIENQAHNVLPNKHLDKQDSKPETVQELRLMPVTFGDRSLELRLVTDPKSAGGGTEPTSGADRISTTQTLTFDELLEPSLESGGFEAVFLFDDSGRVVASAGENDSDLVLRQLPEGLAKDDEEPAEQPADPAVGQLPARIDSQGNRVASTSVRELELADGVYALFLQPGQAQLTRSEGKVRSQQSSLYWSLGGLKSRSRMRDDSMALGAGQILLLTLLILALALGWPFLKILSMGPRERLEVKDVLFLVFALTMASGTGALLLLDTAFVAQLRGEVDDQLAALAASLESKTRNEISRGLELLTKPDSTPLRDTASETARIGELACARISTCSGDNCREAELLRFWNPETPLPYPSAEMAVWIGDNGFQRFKWSVKEKTTPVISVETRPYFRRANQHRLWQLTDRENGLEFEVLPPPFFLESIRSRNTGLHRSVLSTSYPPRPADDSCSKSHQEGARESPVTTVAALTTPLATLDSPVMAPGFGFAVVDRDGQVQFHANVERTLEENFFQETGQSPTLQAAVAARSRVFLNTRYEEKHIRLLSWPLADMPLTLLVYHDRDYPRTLNSELVVMALFLFLVYLSLLFVVFLVVFFVTRGRAPGWLWPDRRYRAKYSSILGILALYSLVLVLQAAFDDTGRSIPGAYLLPLQAIGFTLILQVAGSRRAGAVRKAAWTLAGISNLLLILTFEQSGPTRAILLALFGFAAGILVFRLERWQTKTRPRPVGWRYPLAALVALILFGMLPATLFFRILYVDHVVRMVRHGQLEIARGLDERKDRIENHFLVELGLETRENLDDPDLGRLLIKATVGRPGVPADREPPGVEVAAFFSTTVSTAPPLSTAAPYHVREREPGRPAGIRSWLANRAPFLPPFFNSISIETRQLFQDRSADPSWRTRLLPPSPIDPIRRSRLVLDLVPLMKPRPTSSFEQPPAGYVTRLVSRVPMIRLPRNPLWWAGLLGLFGGLMGLIRFTSRRVLLVDLEVADAVTLEELASRKEIANSLFVVCPPLGERSRLLNDRQRFSYLALHRITEASAIPEPEGGNETVLCVDHFEHRFDDAVWNEQLLNWLEERIYREERTVILLSEVTTESLLAITASGRGEGDDQADEDEQRVQRWTRLLGSFFKVTVRDHADRRTFRARLMSQKESLVETWIGRTGTGGEQLTEQIVDVLETLVDECDSKELLQQVAESLLNHPRLGRFSVREIVVEIAETADQYYRRLWATLSADEKLVLAQLSHGAFVNHKSGRALRKLLAHRILLRDPGVRLMNQSFARFVRGMVPAGLLNEWEGEGGRSVWQLIRTPLYMLVVVLAVFLFATQRDLLKSTLALTSGLTLGLPALFQLLNLAQRSRGQTGS